MSKQIDNLLEVELKDDIGIFYYPLDSIQRVKVQFHYDGSGGEVFIEGGQFRANHQSLLQILQYDENLIVPQSTFGDICRKLNKKPPAKHEINEQTSQLRKEIRAYGR